jgi:hypothetical protein
VLLLFNRYYVGLCGSRCLLTSIYGYGVTTLAFLSVLILVGVLNFLFCLFNTSLLPSLFILHICSSCWRGRFPLLGSSLLSALFLLSFDFSLLNTWRADEVVGIEVGDLSDI